MTYTQITLIKADGLATLTLMQPEKLNAVSRRIRPLATLFSITPPATHNFFSPVFSWR